MGDNRLDHTRVVLDPESIGNGQEKGIGLGDRFNRLELMVSTSADFQALEKATAETRFCTVVLRGLDDGPALNCKIGPQKDLTYGK